MADLELDVRDHVLTITLNRPDRYNAFLPSTYDELLAAVDRADTDDDVRAVIITGAGRGFCSGADLGRGGSTFDYPAGKLHRDYAGRVALRFYDCTVPIIGAING